MNRCVLVTSGVLVATNLFAPSGLAGALDDTSELSTCRGHLREALEVAALLKTEKAQCLETLSNWGSIAFTHWDGGDGTTAPLVTSSGLEPLLQLRARKLIQLGPNFDTEIARRAVQMVARAGAPPSAAEIARLEAQVKELQELSSAVDALERRSKEPTTDQAGGSAHPQ